MYRIQIDIPVLPACCNTVLRRPAERVSERASAVAARTQSGFCCVAGVDELATAAVGRRRPCPPSSESRTRARFSASSLTPAAPHAPSPRTHARVLSHDKRAATVTTTGKIARIRALSISAVIRRFFFFHFHFLSFPANTVVLSRVHSPPNHRDNTPPPSPGRRNSLSITRNSSEIIIL